MNLSHYVSTERINKAVSDLIREHALAVEQLTENQLAEAIRQALASGDFVRLVREDSAQGVVYIPFAEAERLKSEINELQTQLDLGLHPHV